MSLNSRYVKLATKFWTDEKIINLPHKVKLVNLYVLTSPHSNMAGYYRLPKAYIQADLQISKEELEKAFTKLLQEGLIKYCDKSSIILIPNYYKYNPIQNKNQAKGALKRTRELPKNSLVKDYKKSIQLYAAKHKDVLYKGLPEAFDIPLGEGLCNTVTVTETVTEESNICSDSDESNDEIVDNSVDKKNKFEEDSAAYKAALYLRNKILENNKRQPVPEPDPKSLQDWCVELERLNRIGPVGADVNAEKGYNWNEIGRLINFSQDDSFWKSNILSAGKLREKITTLETQMNNRKSKGSNGKYKNNNQEIDDNNYKWKDFYIKDWSKFKE